MAKNIIFYFSGTGNSLAAAKRIARQLGDCEVAFMKGAFTPAAHYERMGFVLPCYAGGAPKPAMEFLKNMPLTGGSADYIFSVITCNQMGGDASFMLDKALRQKGLRLHYAKPVRMVGNYVIQYPIPPGAEELLQTADRQLLTIAAEIEQKAETKPPQAAPLFHCVLWHRQPLFSLQGKAAAGLRRLHGLRPVRWVMPGGQHRHARRQAGISAQKLYELPGLPALVPQRRDQLRGADRAARAVSPPGCRGGGTAMTHPAMQ